MKTLLATLALTAASFAYSDVTYSDVAHLPVSCGPSEGYHKITEEAGEDTGFVGAGKNADGGKIYTVITGNKDFGNWTVAIIHPETNLVCIVAFGEQFSYSVE